MILDERFETYMDSLTRDNSDLLLEIEKEAKSARVPIIRKGTQNYLKVMLQMKQPKRILEVGTAVGFSAILMAVYNPVDCQIDTIENYEKRIPIAKKNFERAALSEKIHLLEGDAQKILPTLQGTYDFIFMDAAKGQYPIFLPEIKRLMHAGSVLVTDNVLQDGDLIESHYAIERRNRTIHKRMREYLYSLTHDEDFVCSILPGGDGLALCTMK